jgi:hypothetical protein
MNRDQSPARRGIGRGLDQVDTAETCRSRYSARLWPAYRLTRELRHNLAAHGSAYAALAEALEGPLVTLRGIREELCFGADRKSGGELSWSANMSSEKIDEMLHYVDEMLRRSR